MQEAEPEAVEQEQVFPKAHTAAEEEEEMAEQVMGMFVARPDQMVEVEEEEAMENRIAALVRQEVQE